MGLRHQNAASLTFDSDEGSKFVRQHDDSVLAHAGCVEGSALAAGTFRRAPYPASLAVARANTEGGWRAGLRQPTTLVSAEILGRRVNDEVQPTPSKIVLMPQIPPCFARSQSPVDHFRPDSLVQTANERGDATQRRFVSPESNTPRRARVCSRAE